MPQSRVERLVILLARAVVALAIAVCVGVVLLFAGFVAEPDYEVRGIATLFGMIGIGAIALLGDLALEACFVEELWDAMFGSWSERWKRTVVYSALAAGAIIAIGFAIWSN